MPLYLITTLTPPKDRETGRTDYDAVYQRAETTCAVDGETPQDALQAYVEQWGALPPDVEFAVREATRLRVKPQVVD